MPKAISLPKPLQGHIVVTQLEKKITGGWVYSDDVKYQTQVGTVLTISKQSDFTDNGFEFKNPGVKIGDSVLYKSWGSTEYTADGIKYQFVRIRDIVAII